MRIQHDGRTQHLTYCLNVHPGEALADTEQAVARHAAEVRDHVGGTEPFGLGLRIAAAAAQELQDPGALARLRELISAQNMYAFTINGFPYGAFHGTRVKDAVYAPDWRSAERLDYTLQLARILAALLPEGVDGSISTVPGAYAAWIKTPDDVAAMHAQLRTLAEGLARIESEQGRHIEVCLEPEPDCHLQTTAETITFLETLYAGGEHCRPYIGACLDTCHSALQYEDPIANLQAYAAAGIPVSKIQISAAIATQDGPAAREALAPFDEAVYLHQVKTRDAAGTIGGFSDLDLALAGPPSEDEWRVHFHVPLYHEGDSVLQSTATELGSAFFAAASATPHLEIETYTFDVLPDALRAQGVASSTTREYRWVLDRMPRS